MPTIATATRSCRTTHHTPATPPPDTSSVSSVVAPPPPLPPRQRAFPLYCEGHRSPTIAARLGVPERTVRAWIAADLRTLTAAQSPTTRQELLQLAITRQLAIAAAAWDAYHQLRAASDAARAPDSALDSLSSVAPSSPPSSPPSVSSVSSVVAVSAPGARYLRLAQAAYREIARLQGLHLPAPADDQPQEVRIILERIPDDEPNVPPDGMFPCTSSPATPAETATPTESPAKTAIPHPPTGSCAACRACPPHHPGDDPAATPAETAPAPLVGERAGESGASPAETATTTRSSPPMGERLGEGFLGLPRFRERSRRPVPPLFAHRL